MGETESPHVHDFGIFGRVPEPQNQYHSSLETPGYLKKTMNKRIIFGNLMFGNLKMSEIAHFIVVGNGGSRTIPKIRVINS